jgi:hypothetical protein
MTQKTYEESLRNFREKHAKPVPKRKPERPLNPLSDYWVAKDGTRRSAGEADMIKIGRFFNDVYKVKAVAENRSDITLGKYGAKIEQVDCINGIWHIQNKFPHEITRVRDKDMVLIKKLNRIEDTKFEYWSAKLVGYNCFGPFISKDNTYDYIVAKYETDNGALWGYGKTLEAARAYLGLKLYDEYKEIIHQIACRNKLKGLSK